MIHTHIHSKEILPVSRQITVDEYVSSHEMIRSTCTKFVLVYGITFFLRL